MKPVPPGLCALTPILEGRLEELRACLAALPTGSRSPLARVEGLHFGRFTVVDGLIGRRGERHPDAPALLMFATEFDGALDAHLDAVWDAMGEDADRVWSHCAGYPGADRAAFARYLRDHRVRPGYSVVSYPEATLGDVRRVLALRDRLAAFALAHRDADDASLAAAWRRELPAEA